MALDVRPFVDTVDNVDILNAIRNHATVDYQRRIPEATKANVQDTVQKLLGNRPSMNEFIDALVNRIGLVIFKNNTWTNPLAKFKRGMLEYGDTIEEIVTGLLEAKEYITDRDYLEKDIFGQETPEVQASYHKVNRQNYYKLTVKEPLLRRAFLTPNGLQEFVTDLMTMPTTSDNWDEFLLTTSLFGEYERSGGFFKVNVPDVSSAGSDEADAKYTLRRLREYADNLKFISRHYNASGMPVAATPDDLELFITPEANAALDVEALAGAFNIEKANFASRTTVIPREHFNIPGAQAILTTREFFVIADQRIDTTNAINPVGLLTNYFLHHWQVISASRFVPALLFTTDAGTVINLDSTPVVSVSEITAIDGDGVTATDFARGELYEVNAQAVTDPAGGVNDAVRWELSGHTSKQTRITQSGAVYIGVDEAATSVTVTAHAVDTAIPQTLATKTFDIVGDKLTLWPSPNVEIDSDGDGDFEVTPEALEMDENNVVTIPSVTGVQYKKDGVSVTNGSTHTIATETTFTAEARSGYELTAGTWTWTFGD